MNLREAKRYVAVGQVNQRGGEREQILLITQFLITIASLEGLKGVGRGLPVSRSDRRPASD